MTRQAHEYILGVVKEQGWQREGKGDDWMVKSFEWLTLVVLQEGLHRPYSRHTLGRTKHKEGNS